MSFGKALYFPYIHFKDEDWLKYSLLYWDGVKRIVPKSYQPQDSAAVKLLADKNLIENVDPQSGETPYAQGATDEFVPTVKDLLEKRGGKLGRGSRVTANFEQNANTALVHVQKMDERVTSLLSSSGLAQQAGNWYAMDGDLAGYYMLCLAAHIGEKQNAPLLSDSFEMETGGTFFQHSRLSPKTPARRGEVSFTLARLAMPIPRPKDLGHVPMAKIVDFHQRFQAERMQFRKAIEDATKEAGALSDSTAIRDFLQEKQATIKTAVEDRRKTLRELKVETVNSFMSISVPGLLSATALSSFGPVGVAIGSTVGIALSAVSWLTKRRGEKRKAIRDSDWHYLLSLEKNFRPKEAAAGVQSSFNQFIYD